MNRADVELLNQSMAGLGNTFMQNRAMAQRASEAEMERELKQKMLEEQIQGRKDVATQTNAVREDNAKARQQHFEAEMQHWKNMEGGTPAAQIQRKQESLKMALQANAQGQLDDDARKKVNDWLSSDEHFGPTGIQLSAPAQLKNSNYGPVQADKYASQLEDQADQLEKQMGTGPGQFDQSIQDKANKLRERAKGIRTPPNQAYQTVTEKEDPFNPGQPVNTTTYRQPIGAPMPGGSSTPAPKKLPPDLAMQFLQRAGGDRNKARALATAAGYTDLSGTSTK